ncbi:hypothetical protein SD78_1735 [Bacillus badius]|nr:hypothetical protein SD78_1735 [Bacillus badius]
MNGFIRSYIKSRLFFFYRKVIGFFMFSKIKKKGGIHG